jgi:NAD(P)-dependent dehydrogenase (short-subunit alcohol dehydrogenase family)
MAKTVVVLGARNLGGAIVDHFLGLGWNAAAVARSEETLERIRARGALALSADASDHAALTDALAQARRELGSVDAVVNAVTASRPPSGGPFGGGELADADLAAFRGWTVAVAEQAFVFLSTGAAALKETGTGALVQITGGSSRRAMPGKGPPRRSCVARESTSRCWPSTRRSNRRRPPRSRAASRARHSGTWARSPTRSSSSSIRESGR